MLVVAGDPDLRRSLRESLLALGCRVWTSPPGVRPRALLRSRGGAVGLALVDVAAAGGPLGLAALQAAAPAVPFCLLAGGRTSARQAAALGAVAALTRPVSPAALAAVLKRVFDPLRP